MNKITDQQVLDAVSDHKGNKSQAARSLGMSRSALRDRLTRLEAGHSTTERLAYKSRQERDTWYIEINGDERIRNADDAIAKAGVDPAIWEIERVLVNGWDTTMKMRIGDEDKVTVNQNQQIKVWLRRKVPLIAEKAAEALIKRMNLHSPKYPKLPKFKKIKDPHLLEVSVFDHHFGKLAWGEETGTNYDLDIAERIFKEAVEDLLAKAKSFPVERILFPVGQDFFHVDNPANTTINGTVQDVDGRYQKMFQTGALACIKMIDRMSQIAPVDILSVPGNHDRTMAWYLAAYLKAWYRLCDRVSVDLSPKLRKYYPYGATLIGLTHGDEEKHRDLPIIMAGEVPQLWAESLYREIHTGHWHKKKETWYNSCDTHGGVPVRVLPSLSGTDFYHYRKGYVNNRQAAEAYLYSFRDGYAGHLSSRAPVYGE